MNEITPTLQAAVAAVSKVPGVRAIVLGGSRARGIHSPDSDIDVGIYYNRADLDIQALDRAAQDLDDDHRNNLVSPPGEWGEWVNGGAWLSVHNHKVDFILRDIERVATSVRECQNGIVSAHYQPGHPHAFINAMYAGELAASKLLWTATTEVTNLKEQAERYSPELKTALIDFFSFEADFSCTLASKNANRGDRYYVTAHLIRAVSGLNQILFALNETYCLNEKNAVKTIDSFPIKPDNYGVEIDRVFADVGSDLQAACERLARLLAAVNDISRIR